MNLRRGSYARSKCGGKSRRFVSRYSTTNVPFQTHPALKGNDILDSHVFATEEQDLYSQRPLNNDSLREEIGATCRVCITLHSYGVRSANEP
jgi:hypothetical protein